MTCLAPQQYPNAPRGRVGWVVMRRAVRKGRRRGRDLLRGTRRRKGSMV